LSIIFPVFYYAPEKKQRLFLKRRKASLYTFYEEQGISSTKQNVITTKAQQPSSILNIIV